MAGEKCCGVPYIVRSGPDKGSLTDCARMPEHRGQHRDREAMDYENAREKQRRELKGEQIRAYDRNRATPERRAMSHKTRPFPAATDGFCYLLAAPWVPAGLLKIGSCTDLKENLKAAQRYLPGAVHLRIYETGYRRLEYYLHDYFETRRMTSGLREWFWVSAVEVDAVVASVSDFDTLCYSRK